MLHHPQQAGLNFLNCPLQVTHNTQMMAPNLLMDHQSFLCMLVKRLWHRSDEAPIEGPSTSSMLPTLLGRDKELASWTNRDSTEALGSSEMV